MNYIERSEEINFRSSRTFALDEITIFKYTSGGYQFKSDIRGHVSAVRFVCVVIPCGCFGANLIRSGVNFCAL